SAAQSINITLPINSLSDVDDSIITSIPLEYVTFPDVGKVATPHLKTTILNDSREIPVTFLVDSGAKISALPLSYIDQVGLDRDTAKRIYLRSATNTTTYGYLSEIQLRVNNTTVTIPIAYADIIEPLLGTHGFFDRFTVIFENGQKLIIKQKT
ncbi:MAG TPA: retroviral-like aspartic protease family protein, partial [Anaerolineales bacterium]|nr:retroviral-like aspartic protease family protein [Anaerolineales bacterium]